METKNYSGEVRGWLMVYAILFLAWFAQEVLDLFWLLAWQVSYELIIWKILIIFFIGWVGQLFFRRQETAPSWMIIFLVISFLLYIILYSSEDPRFIPQEFVVAVIWIPYFGLSKRVENTFVYRKKVKVKPPQQFDGFLKKMVISVLLIVLIPAGVSGTLTTKIDEIRTQWSDKPSYSPEQVEDLDLLSFY